MFLQGTGNLVNGCVILVAMAMFGQTGRTLDPNGSRNVMIVNFAVGCVCWHLLWLGASPN